MITTLIRAFTYTYTYQVLCRRHMIRIIHSSEFSLFIRKPKHVCNFSWPKISNAACIFYLVSALPVLGSNGVGVPVFGVRLYISSRAKESLKVHTSCGVSVGRKLYGGVDGLPLQAQWVGASEAQAKRKRVSPQTKKQFFLLANPR